MNGLLSLNRTFRHFVKSIKTKLFKASKLKSCQNLKNWMGSIVNMIWWSLGTSKGIFQLYPDHPS